MNKPPSPSAADFIPAVTPEGAPALNRYLPVPKNGALCPVSGFGHARFYSKVINGSGRDHVRILDLKEPGQSRGTKFYHAGDLLAWLDSLATRGGRAA